MYDHDSRQLSIQRNPETFGGVRLDPGNRWVRAALAIPWDRVEALYLKGWKPSPRGEQAKPARVAFGCLFIKRHFAASDRETVQLIRESPYLQYFLGRPSYDYNYRIGASTVSDFRSRFPEDVLEQVDGWIREEAGKDLLRED